MAFRRDLDGSTVCNSSVSVGSERPKLAGKTDEESLRDRHVIAIDVPVGP